MIRFTLIIAAICIAVTLVIDASLLPLEKWLRTTSLLGYKTRLVLNVSANGVGWVLAIAASVYAVRRATYFLPHLKEIDLRIESILSLAAMLVPYALFVAGSTFATMFFATLLYQGRWSEWLGAMKWVALAAVLWGVALNLLLRWQNARRTHRHEAAVRLGANRPDKI